VEQVDQEMEKEMKTTMSLDEVRSPFSLFPKLRNTCSDVARERKRADPSPFVPSSSRRVQQLESYYASVSPVISYRAALSAGEPDWLKDQFAKIKEEGGEGWDGKTRVNVRRVLSLVVWKRE